MFQPEDLVVLMEEEGTATKRGALAVVLSVKPHAICVTWVDGDVDCDGFYEPRRFRLVNRKGV